MAGVAVIITVHQLPDLLGAGAASGSTIHRLARDLRPPRTRSTSWPLGIGLAVLAIIIVSEKIDRRIPAALIGLVGSTIARRVRRAGELMVSSSSGPVATGLPKVGIPSVSWGDVGSVIPVSLTVALVCLAQTAATVRSFSQRRRRESIDRDFVALGAGNILSGFAGVVPGGRQPCANLCRLRSAGTDPAGLPARGTW